MINSIQELDKKRDNGRSITCTISSTYIAEAKLSFCKDSYGGKRSWYICQNLSNGITCLDKKGFLFSFFISDEYKIILNTIKFVDKNNYIYRCKHEKK